MAPDGQRATRRAPLAVLVRASFYGGGVDLDRDALILSLHEQGHSVRAIAARVGLGRSRVHEIISGEHEHAGEDAGDFGHRSVIAYLEPGDGTAELLAALDDEAGRDDFEPPFRVLGAERVLVPDRGDGRGGREVEPRYADAAGRSVNALGLYRSLARLSAEQGYEYTDAIRADLKRQRAEQGLVYVNVPGVGGHWEQR